MAHGDLKRLRPAVGAQRDRLTVQNRLAQGQAARRFDDLRHCSGDLVEPSLNTRTSSPPLCTWMRAPSSLYSNAARPSVPSASATSSAGWASIGLIGRNSWTANPGHPVRPSPSAARATVPKSPAIITAPDVVGRQPTRLGDGFGHQAFERALAQLAEQQPDQEILLVGRGAGEQLVQQPGSFGPAPLPRTSTSRSRVHRDRRE